MLRQSVRGKIIRELHPIQPGRKGGRMFHCLLRAFLRIRSNVALVTVDGDYAFQQRRLNAGDSQSSRCSSRAAPHARLRFPRSATANLGFDILFQFFGQDNFIFILCAFSLSGIYSVHVLATSAGAE
jgi:hypothetical protein